MEHSEPKLRQLLGSSAPTDVVAASWLINLPLVQTNILLAAWGFGNLTAAHMTLALPCRYLFDEYIQDFR
jgi:hypothetical protein